LYENIPFGMRRLLADHDVKHASEESWDGLSNGSLIAVAEAADYDVLLTADKNLRYQQNLADRALAIVVIGANHWKTVRRNAHRVVEALVGVTPGAFVVVNFDRPGRGARDRG
jgi:hypothetical protein